MAAIQLGRIIHNRQKPRNADQPHGYTPRSYRSDNSASGKSDEARVQNRNKISPYLFNSGSQQSRAEWLPSLEALCRPRTEGRVGTRFGPIPSKIFRYQIGLDIDGGDRGSRGRDNSGRKF